MLEWKIANACGHEVLVDVASARVFAIAALFARVPLAPRDARAALTPGYLEPGEVAYVRVAYVPRVTADQTIEVELDAFDDESHRPVTIAVLPPPPIAHAPRRAPPPAGDGARDSW